MRLCITLRLLENIFSYIESRIFDAFRNLFFTRNYHKDYYPLNHINYILIDIPNMERTYWDTLYTIFYNILIKIPGLKKWNNRIFDIIQKKTLGVYFKPIKFSSNNLIYYNHKILYL